MHRSLWLQEALGPSPDVAPPLVSDTRADVAIIGGGYVGLWTAIRIKERDPSCDVVLIEQDVCGGGASGRNGGFVLSWWPKLPTLIARFGKTGALALARASDEAIGEIGRFCEAHHIDAHFRQAGWLWTATTTAQLGSWDPPVRRCEELGAHPFERLPDADVGRRAGSNRHLAGVLEARAATVQPAELVRGLRRVACDLKVRVYEHTRVEAIDRRSPSVVRTPSGRVTAAKVIIATNAWAASLRELARAIVVISSDIVATPPIPERLARIGWTGGEAITDSQQMVDYYRTTRDGRIVFGKGGWGIALGGRIGSEFDRNATRAAEVTADFHRVYPMLTDVPIDRDWSGAVDRSTDGLPLIGHLGGRRHLLYGIGWSGNGVGPSVVGGRILASLALDLDDEWSRSPLVDRPFGKFPPEPIRFLGAHIVRAAVSRKERAEALERRPHPLAVALSKLAPEGLEGH